MPDSKSTQDDRPTQNELIAEVERHGDGIDAVTLGRTFESQGYGQYSVQRAIRRALDKGTIELGPRLRLRKRSAA
jgi:hypothetical protein